MLLYIYIYSQMLLGVGMRFGPKSEDYDVFGKYVKSAQMENGKPVFLGQLVWSCAGFLRSCPSQKERWTTAQAQNWGLTSKHCLHNGSRWKANMVGLRRVEASRCFKGLQCIAGTARCEVSESQQSSEIIWMILAISFSPSFSRTLQTFILRSGGECFYAESDSDIPPRNGNMSADSALIRARMCNN